MDTNETVEAPMPNKRPWGKYLKRFCYVSVALAVVLRLAVPLALPSILSKIAGEKGLQVTYSKLDLSMFAGSMELWDVSVRPLAEIEGGESSQFGQLEFLTVDVDVSALLGGTLRAHRVEIDGLDVYAQRESAEAGWAWKELLQEGRPVEVAREAAPTEEQDPDQEADAGPEPFDWSLGFEVAAIRLQHVQVHVEDRAVEPPFTADIELNVRLSHLGLSDRAARLEIFAHSLELLDGFSINGSLQANGPDLELVCQVDMRGLRATGLKPYLAPLGVMPMAKHIDCGLSLELKTQTANEDATALHVQALASNVRWIADGRELIALDEFVLEVPQLSRTSLVAETARIRGVRGEAYRTADGAIALAGFGFHGASSSQETTEPEAEETQPDSDSTTASFDLSIPKLELSEVTLHWLDETLVPSPSLNLELKSLAVGPLRHAAGVASEPIHIEVHGSAPGLLKALDLVGDVDVFAEEQSVDLQVSMAGFKPESVAPYLNAAGLSSDFKAGSGSLQIQARTHVDADGVRHMQASLNDLVLQDGETLFALQSVALKGMRLHPAEAVTRIEELSVGGTDLRARRDKDGVWHCLGIALGTDGSVVRNVLKPRVSEEEAEAEVAPATDKPSPAQASGPPALFELSRLAITGTRIEVLDESLKPNVHQVLDDLGLVVTGLSLGGAASDEQAAPAQIELWFQAQGLAERLALQGTLQSSPGPLHVRADLELQGQSLELTAVQPWLEPLGIESLWQQAQLGMRVKAHAKAVGADTHVGLQLTDLTFENLGQSWLSMGALRVPLVVLSQDGIRMEPISIEEPGLLLRRNSEGSLEALGLRFHPIVASESPGASRAPRSNNSESEGSGGGAGPAIQLAGLQVSGVNVRWQDDAVVPAVDTSLRLDLGLQDLVLGEATSAPVTWFTQLSVDDNLASLRAEGSAWLDPNDLRSQVQVSMSGLRPGSLGAYMPANMGMELKDGRMSWQLDAKYTAREEGGHALSLQATGLVFRDGESGPELLGLPRLALNVPVLDPRGHRFDVQELSLQGLVLPLRVDDVGRIHGLGFSLDPSVQTGVVADEPKVQVAELEDQPLASGGTDQVALSTAEDRVLPLVTLNGLDVGIAKLSFVDDGGGAPLDFSLHLIQAEPMTLLAPEAADLPSLKFKLEGAANPIVDSISVELDFAPYATEPSFDLRALIAGVHGDQVTSVLPNLAETLDGSAWTDGQLQAHVQGQMLMRRRGPLDFELGQGFGLELTVAQVGVKATADGPDLLGFEELTATVQSIRPETGDVHVKRVEWVNPHGSAWQDEEGLHVAGWVLKSTPPIDESAEVAADDDAETLASESEAAVALEEEPLAEVEPGESTSTEVPVLAQADSGPEIRIDEVLISGGTFLFEDRTVQPAFVFPIADVDFQAKRFTTRTLQEERPFDFRLALYGGEVELPERTGGGNLIGGLLGSVAALVGDDEFVSEQRPVFDELTLRGKMSLGPMPKGWLQMRLRGFELPAVRGHASASGVDIGDGLMGESAMLHMDGKGGLRISSNTQFTYLSLSEPPGGPISSYLKLPAPLDTVLFVLKDEDGDHGIPLHLTMDEGGASVGAILGAVTKSLGLLIGEALASAPMRLITGVVDLAGLQAEPIELTGDEWVDVPFPAGVVQTPISMKAQVALLLDLLRRDPTLYLTVEHGLGKDDVVQAQVLANPSRSECLELAAFYRRRRTDLLRDRDDAAAEVRSAYALGQAGQVRVRTAALQNLDTELGQTEAALDRVLERTRDQSDRAQLRRTKIAALEVSRRRLSRVEASLRRAKISSIGTRIDARRPRYSKTQEQSQGFIRISVKRRR